MGGGKSEGRARQEEDRQQMSRVGEDEEVGEQQVREGRMSWGEQTKEDETRVNGDKCIQEPRKEVKRRGKERADGGGQSFGNVMITGTSVGWMYGSGAEFKGSPRSF